MKRQTKMYADKKHKSGGNAIALVFMAIGMAGVVTYGLNNIMRGPAVTAAETSRRTIAENNMVAATRLAITAAARQQDNGGDCDMDGFVEPIPFRDAGGLPTPIGGGLVPMTLGASMTDPWGTQYGYCVWDPGTVSQSDNHAGCGNATGTANRLQGAPRDDQPAIAIISAGRNGDFETTCNAYLDTVGDGKPDTPLVVQDPNSDDIILSYTYAEANGIGGGLWKLREADPSIAEIGMGIKSTSQGGATFGGAVELTSRGLVLPGDPGDNSVTGVCNEAKEGQLRRNLTGTPATPPTIEICDFAGSGDWVQISATPGVDNNVFNPNVGNCTVNNGGPFTIAGNSTVGGNTFTSLWSRVYADDQIIFAARNSDGLQAIRFDGTTFTVLDSYGVGGTGWQALWGDSQYLYASSAWSNTRLAALTFNGTNFVEAASLSSIGTAGSENGISLWGQGGTLFLGLGGATPQVSAYSFNGSAFGLLGSTNTYAPSALWGNSLGLYIGSAWGDASVTQWDGTSFSPFTVTSGNGYHGNKIWANQDFIFSVHDSDGLVAHTYDGTTLASVAQDFVPVRHWGLWGDGVYLYATTESGVRAYSFDGTSFTLVADVPAITNGGAIWGDGRYIYVGTDSNRIYALAGFACTSTAAGGGGPTAPSETAKDSFLPDPLDVGLVAHWKMNEAAGVTTIEDSIGDNHGTLLNNASRTAGPDGSNGVSLDGVNNNSNVRVSGLLGQNTQMTIAGWIKSGELRGNTGFDRAQIFTVGDNVNITEFYDDESSSSTASGIELGWRSGGTWYGTGTSNQLMGSGWRYVVGTLDSANGAFRFFLNGELAGERIQNLPVTYNSGGTDTYFGRNSGDATTWNWNGSVDDFRIYSRALSPEEAVRLSQREMAKSVIAAPVLRSSLRVNGKSDKLSVAQDYACAIKDDGTLWCWGRNNHGQLGNGGSGTFKNAPVPILEPETQVYYLNNTNSDLSIGGSTFSKKMLPYEQTAQAATGVFAASQTRTAYGFTDPGMPGITGASGMRHYTVTMQASAARACIAAGATVQRINAAGVMQNDLTLNAVGANTLGGTVTLSAIGDLGTFVATDRLRVTYTLNNTCGGSQATFNLIAQLHTPLNAHTPWLSVSAAERHACGIQSDGSAWCWGNDASQQLGDSGLTATPKTTPSRVVDTGTPWVSLSANYSHTCGIQSDGSAWCWGEDGAQQLGNGAGTTTQAQPVRAGSDNDWSSITTGAEHTCALKTNGRAWCWGADGSGQQGNGSGGANNAPQPVLDASRWVKLSAYMNHTCGIKTDGTLWCWGANDSNQLGTQNGTTQIPTQIHTHHNDWVDVSSGRGFVCGIRKDGNVYCWGQSHLGSLGLPHSTTTYVPQRVPGMSEAAAVSAGGHACAMKTSGALHCWGEDTYGQLGNGFLASANLSFPTPVLGFPGSPNWSLNDVTNIIAAPYQYNVGLNGSFIGDVGNNSRGFGFTSAGRARLFRDAGGGMQLALQTGAGGSSQLSFKTSPAFGTQDVTHGLTGRWTFDTNGNASVGASVNGALVGTPVFTTNGRNAGAITLDGVDDYVNIPRSSGVQEHTGSFTVSFWAYRTGTQAANANIVVKLHPSGAPHHSYLFSYTGGQLQFSTGHTDNTNMSGQLLANLPDQKWTHVVGTFNSTGTQNLKLYLDGRLAGTANKAVAIRYQTNASSRLYVGGCPSCDLFKGAVDDLRIYNRTLTEHEVLQLYAAQNTPAQNVFSMGIDHTNNRFEIATNTATPGALSATASAMNVLPSGLTGIGPAAPTARLDVQGGVRFGSDAACDADREGAIRYSGGTPAWSYCDGTDWVEFSSGSGGATWKRHASDNAGCGIRSNGRAYCWGSAEFGRLGNNQTAVNALQPIEVHSDTNATGWNDWVQIVGGPLGGWYTGNVTCGLRSGGTLWCWGWNTRGAIGDGTYDDRSRPRQVRNTANNGVWSDWVQISGVSGENMCGIRTNGRAYCWGYTQASNIGNGTNSWPEALTPQEVHTNSGSPGWSDWVQISTGQYGSCGIRRNGTAWCWGDTSNGRLGNGNSPTGNQTRPVQVRDSSGTAAFWSDWVKIRTDATLTCGIRANGRAYCWGENSGGEIGNNGSTGHQNYFPREVKSGGCAGGTFTDWKDIAIGNRNWDGDGNHVCMVRANGEAWCWGNGNHGKLGDGPTTHSHCPVRVRDSAGTGHWSDWVKIMAGDNKTCGTRGNGTLWCWGEGPLGDGGTSDSNLPRQVN